ncbi:hypothetical protein [Chitinolyticbacter albus]|uniref:hypothetical protein n=1 Tax=Chitinolyticbacter albus TaxID=2961951 RepID=UPI00210EBF60|nr:hypothetical protein [Chitinolyticbacter albus]
MNANTRNPYLRAQQATTQWWQGWLGPHAAPAIWDAEAWKQLLRQGIAARQAWDGEQEAQFDANWRALAQHTDLDGLSNATAQWRDLQQSIFGAWCQLWQTSLALAQTQQSRVLGNLAQSGKSSELALTLFSHLEASQREWKEHANQWGELLNGMGPAYQQWLQQALQPAQQSDAADGDR